MKEHKFDLKHSNEVMERMNREVNEFRKNFLKDKTPEEQEQIKMEWEKNDELARQKADQEIKKRMDKIEKKFEKRKKNESELIPIEDIKDGLNGMIKDLDDKWDETLQSAIEDLCKGKTEEEKEKIMNAFKNSFMNNQEK